MAIIFIVNIMHFFNSGILSPLEDKKTITHTSHNNADIKKHKRQN